MKLYTDFLYIRIFFVNMKKRIVCIFLSLQSLNDNQSYNNKTGEKYQPGGSPYIAIPGRTKSKSVP